MKTLPPEKDAAARKHVFRGAIFAFLLTFTLWFVFSEKRNGGQDSPATPSPAHAATTG